MEKYRRKERGGWEEGGTTSGDELPHALHDLGLAGGHVADGGHGPKLR